MNKKIFYTTAIMILLVMSLFLLGCEGKKPGVMAGPAAGKATLHVTVIDNETQEPIENATFYLGNGVITFQTDKEGKCFVEGNSIGQYSANAYKKGYARFMEPITLEEGDNQIIIRLEKEQTTPPQISVEGEMKEEVLGEGSRSEAHFIKIRYDDGKEDYIFNSMGDNSIDDMYIGKRVRITGYNDTGYIGWQHQEQEGIYIEGIEII